MVSNPHHYLAILEGFRFEGFRFEGFRFIFRFALCSLRFALGVRFYK